MAGICVNVVNRQIKEDQMTTLAGYRITPAAQLESPHPRELLMFIEHKVNMAPDLMEREEFIADLDVQVRKQFGSQFNVTLIDPETEMATEDWDDTSIIVIDAQTASARIH
jgi:hypothetical protein